MSFTPIKDVNLEIMSKMDDKTLLNVCATNKYGRELCRNESFWRNRFLQKYGEMAAKRKPEKRSWKNHYMRIIIDIGKWSRDPPRILASILWSVNGIKHSRYMQTFENVTPLLDEPESFLNAFYLMDLGPYFNHKTAFQFLTEKSKEINSGIYGGILYTDYLDSRK